MSRVFPAAVPLAAIVAVAACAPTFNWREVTVAPVALRAAFPCKPDKAERKLPFTPDKELLVHAIGCETAGVAYALLWADAGNAADLGVAMSQWKQASLAASHATVVGESPFQPRGALALPQSIQVRAEGRAPGGDAMQSQAAYFGRGTAVFQAVVYASSLKPEATEPFFSGLRFE